MIDGAADTFLATIDACWPAERTEIVGPWTLRLTKGAGGRVSAISGNAPDRIAEAEAAVLAHGQRPGFILFPGQDALDAALGERGYGIEDPVTLWTSPVAHLTTEIMPYATAFTIWPPLR
ncbi:MAG: GNAT family N-acetyltransferase, partial [Jannaschia sp.]